MCTASVDGYVYIHTHMLQHNGDTSVAACLIDAWHGILPRGEQADPLHDLYQGGELQGTTPPKDGGHGQAVALHAIVLVIVGEGGHMCD